MLLDHVRSTRVNSSRLEMTLHNTPGHTVGDAIDQFADGYFEIDRNLTYRRVNAAGARMANRTVEEMIGRGVLELFNDIELYEVHNAVRRVMDGGPAEHVETYYTPLHLWAVNSVYPLADGLAIVSRDITAQKQLEQNLTFLAEASKILSSSLDYEETLQTVANLAVPRIADWCSVDMLTSPDSVELLAVAHVDPAKVRWARELREHDPVDLSAPTGLPRVLRAGKSEFYPEITEEMIHAAARDQEALELIRSIGFSSVMIVPLLIDQRAIGAITFVAAESGRHFGPADLSMAEELASRAALAIQNARLYSSSLHAVALRDDFISVASHELKTPVTSLKVYAQVLQKQADKRGDEQSARSLQRMNAQIDKLTALIGDLLDVSRLESDRLALSYSLFDPNQLVEDVVDTIQQTADRHRIEVDGRSALQVYGDGERIGQVLTNLVTNAIKYSPDADRVIVRVNDTDDAVMVEVQDFGIGIDIEHQARIFDRFYRVSSHDEKTFPGLGIGLYISNQIIRRHGGAIDVTSARGSGSTFSLALPAAADRVGDIDH
jgi:signal transduction histidine kinase